MNRGELNKWADATPTWRLFLIVAGPLLVLYLLTATWGLPYNVDAGTNVLTAWELAEDRECQQDSEVCQPWLAAASSISFLTP